MSSKIRGITVEIGGSTVKLNKALEDVTTKSKSLQKELQSVEKLLKLDPSNTTLLSQKQNILKESINATKNKLQELKGVQDQITAKYKSGEIDEGAYRAFQRELEDTEIKLKNLQKESKNFGSVFAQQVANAGTKVTELGGKIEAVGKKFSVISTVATAGLVTASKSAIDYESAWAGVTKTVEGTDKQLSTIKQGILDLSQSTASSAEDIAQVAENAGQLGVETDNILAFTETMVRLGDSTNISADEASSAIAKLYNIMGSDINTVDQFGSSIVALGNNMATTENDIMNMATRVAGSGKQIGLTEQEILALSASLSSVGLEAEAGGSAISAVMTQIDKDVALNSDTLAIWADVAGMSTGKFKKLWETDAMSAIQSVVKGMGDASAGGENLNVILDDLGVKSLRQTDTMKRLSSASELLGESVKISNEAWDENTALTAESDKRYETTASKIQQLKNTFTELAVKLGDILLPIIQKVVEKVSSIVDWLTNLNPVAQKIILVITALVASLAPALIIIGKVVTAVGQIMTLAPQITKVINGIKTVVKGLFTMISAHPIIAIITAIVAIVVLLYTKCEWFRDGVHKILNAIVNFFKSAWETIKNVWNAIPSFFSGLWESVKSGVSVAWDAITGFFALAWEKIKAVWDFVLPYFKAVWDSIKAVFSVVKTVLVSSFAVAWLGIKAVWDVVAGYFKAVWNTIKGIFSVVKNVLSGNFKGAWDAIKGILNTWAGFFKTVWESIKLIFSAVTGWFRNLFTSAWNAIKTILNTWAGFFKGVWNGIKNIWSSVSSWFKNLFANAWNGIKNAWSGVKSFFSNLWSGIKNIWGNVTSWFKNLFANAWNGIKNAFSNVKSFFSSVKDNIRNAFTDLPSKMLSIGKDVIDGLVNGIKSKVTAVTNAVKDVTSKITKKCKDILGIASPSKVFKAIGEYTSEGLAIGIKGKGNLASDAMGNVVDDVIGKTNTSALMNLGVKGVSSNGGTTTTNNTQTTGGTVINFNGNYKFNNKDDIDYFMNQAGLRLVGVR